VESRVHRILRPLATFHVLGEWSRLQQLAKVQSPLSENERLLGVYENHPGLVDEIVAFTETGMYLREAGGWFSVRYAEIVNAESRNTGKTETSEITLLLSSGLQKALPIHGGTGRFRDVFQVLRFFDRLAEDRTDDLSNDEK
ncbi:MAG: hypothetical protein JWM16_5192, partial [Verrucomicrobiales bacterium]|nr:hypothetical protein [Verrucomicrobiales bacterium]